MVGPGRINAACTRLKSGQRGFTKRKGKVRALIKMRNMWQGEKGRFVCLTETTVRLNKKILRRKGGGKKKGSSSPSIISWLTGKNLKLNDEDCVQLLSFGTVGIQLGGGGFKYNGVRVRAKWIKRRGGVRYKTTAKKSTTEKSKNLGRKGDDTRHKN